MVKVTVTFRVPKEAWWSVYCGKYVTMSFNGYGAFVYHVNSWLSTTVNDLTIKKMYLDDIRYI